MDQDTSGLYKQANSVSRDTKNIGDSNESLKGRGLQVMTGRSIEIFSESNFL